MANTKDFNKVENWGLWCNEMKKTQNAIVLKCGFSQKNKDTGEYHKEKMYIDVICTEKMTNMEDGDYEKALINVTGTFSYEPYEGKKGTVLIFKIFAKEVEIAKIKK